MTACHSNSQQKQNKSSKNMQKQHINYIPFSKYLRKIESTLLECCMLFFIRGANERIYKYTHTGICVYNSCMHGKKIQFNHINLDNDRMWRWPVNYCNKIVYSCVSVCVCVCYAYLIVPKHFYNKYLNHLKSQLITLAIGRYFTHSLHYTYIA